MTTRADKIRALERQLERERERLERCEVAVARWTFSANALRTDVIPPLVNKIRELREKE